MDATPAAASIMIVEPPPRAEPFGALARPCAAHAHSGKEHTSINSGSSHHIVLSLQIVGTLTCQNIILMIADNSQLNISFQCTINLHHALRTLSPKTPLCPGHHIITLFD
ncbi:MAG: hypothetical protein BJ554DRAFT_3071 [Olpidium bornovanus]|uniref:Uncharacterized protein n=1 Tax=Olpidium bornovanus TaxID=278681 RepID=A0A8H8DFU3_9FUNG|nr:MAG: hypothetical protein BJ554DRAFT_3071 [Olpidium bornovanus]